MKKFDILVRDIQMSFIYGQGQSRALLGPWQKIWIFTHSWKLILLCRSRTVCVAKLRYVIVRIVRIT